MTQQSLCWKCENACAKCSWSQDFTPVEGWIAKKTKVKDSKDGSIDSYMVYDCPKFKDDTDQYRSSVRVAPPVAQKKRNISNMSPLRRKVEALPIDELERRIATLENAAIARLALVEHKTYDEICQSMHRSYDSVRVAIGNAVKKIAEAV